MTDERVYEVERLQEFPIEIGGGRGWVFAGNLTIKSYEILATFEARAEEKDWPDGEYRLSHWDEPFASGSFYLVTLTSERRRTAKLVEPKPSEAAA